jgi:hypothetical protein
MSRRIAEPIRMLLAVAVAMICGAAAAGVFA